MVACARVVKVYNPALFRGSRRSPQLYSRVNGMFESAIQSSEARAALYILAAAMIGSIVMGLLSNFVR